MPGKQEPSRTEDSGSEAVQRVKVGDHPYRAAPIVRPKVEVLEDYLLIRDVSCVDADGNRFEYYPELYVARDFERNYKNPRRFSSYEAARHFEQKGMWSPSMALVCNYLKILDEYKSVPEVESVLLQYKDHGAGYGWHVANTLIDSNSGRIIHYPSRDDFQDQELVNEHRRRVEFPFSPRRIETGQLGVVLQDEHSFSFLRNLTGVEDLSFFVELGRYFGKEARLWYWSNVGSRASWLGCNNNYFDLYTTYDLTSSSAARGVRERSEQLAPKALKTQAD